ncbi:MAG: hypothetical protein HON65_12050 [Rhodospirillales bacterium]|jgi:hypothetical protein|nr:hypothetical protein [Rhodospirillales bacterium]
MKLFFSLILILLLSLNREAVAQEPMTCPDKIAMIENYVLAQLTVSILSEIYEDAGCKPEFVEYPGRRGVFYFNKGDVDGEIFRLKIIEKSYERNFVRSSVPLFSVTNSVWHHTNNANPERHIYGYVIGIKWQENYAVGKDMIGFESYEKMYAAYHNNQLTGFLGTDVVVINAIQKDELSPVPIVAENLFEAPLFHYLGYEYTPLMGHISELIVSGNYFSEIFDFTQ